MKLYIGVKNTIELYAIESLLGGNSKATQFLPSFRSDPACHIYDTLVKSQRILEAHSKELFFDDRPLARLVKGVYFGSDTCEHLLSGSTDVLKAIRYCAERKWHIAFRLPPMTQSIESKMKELLELLDSYECEIVANDYGTLSMAGEYPNIQKSIGRLLFKTQRNAMIDSFRQYDVSPQIEANQRENIRHAEYELQSVRELIKSLGVGRIGLENLDTDTAFLTQKPYLNADIYYPYLFLAKGRACESAGLINPDAPFHPQISCAKPCREVMMNFKMSEYNGIFLSTNAYYRANTKLCFEKSLYKKAANRLIWELMA